MESKDYLTLAGIGMGAGVVTLLCLSFLYGLWLDFLEFGPAYYIPRFWEAVSILILGTIATLATRHDAVGWYFSWKEGRWEDYRMPWMEWIPWQSFKVVVVGYLLKSTIFGLALRALLLGHIPAFPLDRVVYGPLLSALLVRTVMYLLNQTPSYKRTPLLYTRIIAATSIIGGLLTLRTITTLLSLKLALYFGLAGAGLYLSYKEKHAYNLILLGLLVTFFFLPNLAEIFLGTTTYDPNLELAGLERIQFVTSNITGIPSERIQQTIALSGRAPSIDPTLLLGTVATIPLNNYEKTGDIQTVLRNDQTYYTVPIMLVKEYPVNQNWNTRHLDYLSSKGIHAYDMAGTGVKGLFVEDTFYYGKDGGFENWAFSTDSSSGGIIMAGLDSLLFDLYLPEHLPGRLMRHREVDKRIDALLPFAEQSDAYLTSDGTNTYWTISLYAELPTDWVPNAKTKTLLEIAIATIDVRTGHVILYQTNQNGLADLLQVSYDLQPMPDWLQEQRLYPEALFTKQLSILDTYYPGTIAKLKPTYLTLISGPALVLEARNVAEQTITGYIEFSCGRDYGVQKLVTLDRPIYPKEKVKELIRTSATKVSEGVDLGPYVTAGRARMGEPAFYPLDGRLVYITPLYVKEGNTNKITHMVITDASSNTMGVGPTIEKAMERFLSG